MFMAEITRSNTSIQTAWTSRSSMRLHPNLGTDGTLPKPGDRRDVTGTISLWDAGVEFWATLDRGCAAFFVFWEKTAQLPGFHPPPQRIRIIRRGPRTLG